MSINLILLLSITLVPATVGLLFMLRSNMYDRKEESLAIGSEKEKMFREMLVEGEELKAYCVVDTKHYYYCAVTNMRIIIEGKDGNKHIYFEHIKNIKYMNTRSNNVSPTNSDITQIMIVVDKSHMISHTDEKYYISNFSSKFSDVVAAIAEGYKK